jgi:hypothetical protein
MISWPGRGYSLEYRENIVMTVIRYGVMAGALVFAAALAVSPVSLRAEDEPAGVVVEPSDVTSAPSDEAAAAQAGGGFDTPADAVQTESPDLQPQGTTAEPNN